MVPRRRSDLFILSLLGILSAVSPFAIDLYLPAFSQMATDFNTTSATVSLSLSSYFIGLALGQFLYGPLLDRFGRKKPIFFGLGIFCLASLGCIFTGNVELLIALRLLQGVGGCVAQVGAIAMVRDFFPANQAAKIFSLLFLFIGASPLLAPSIGSAIMLFFGWHYIFVFMFILVAAILATVMFFLPEGHKPDSSISLKPAHIFGTYIHIFKNKIFLKYTLAGGFAFAGLFANVAAAPIMFMEHFGVSAKAFGIVFPVMAAGFIGGSQINVFLLRHFNSATIFTYALWAQTTIGLIFFLGTAMGWYGLYSTLGLLIVFLAFVGIGNPNSSALALESFEKNIGSASALMNGMRMAIGALVSTSIGAFHAETNVPLIGTLFVSSLLALLIHILLKKPAFIIKDRHEYQNT